MDAAAESVQETMASDALAQLKATLQAAVREVQVDVKEFKQRVEERIEELCVSNRPLAGAVTRLQEENLQLRAKLEALSRLVEGLAGVKIEKSPADVKGKDSLENGDAQIQSKAREVVHCGGSESSQSNQATSSDPSRSSEGWSRAPAAPINTPAPPPWRARRHAEMNVSIISHK